MGILVSFIATRVLTKLSLLSVGMNRPPWYYLGRAADGPQRNTLYICIDISTVLFCFAGVFVVWYAGSLLAPSQARMRSEMQ